MTTTYKIGEAAALLNLKTYVLRFWETEFPEVVPLRTEKGQRLYTAEHLALLEHIRYLLHERGLTIGGARKSLAEEKTRGEAYAFGAPNALAGSAMQAGLALNLDDEGEDAACDDEQDYEPPKLENVTGLAPARTGGDREEETPAIPSLRQAGAKQRPQYDLPGLEQLLALAAERSASADDAGRQPAENLDAELPAQGVLPLFAMVRGAFLAGTVAGASFSGAGGDNFIQAGGDSAATASLAPASLRLLVEELEQVARILRADTPAEPEADVHTPRVIPRESNA